MIERQLRRHSFPDDDRPRGAEIPHHIGITLRDAPRVERAAPLGRSACGVEDVLHADRHPDERARCCRGDERRFEK